VKGDTLNGWYLGGAELTLKKRKKRLCLLLPSHWSASFGGSEYQVRCLLEKIVAQRAFDITYLARDVHPDFNPVGYDIQRVGTGRGFARHGFFFDSMSLLSILKRIQPDVIYQRVGCAYTGVAAFYARHNNSKMVWHIAHDSDVDPFGDVFSFNIISRYIEKKFLEYGIAHSDHVIAQTKQQEDLLYKYYKKEACTIVPNFHPSPREEIRKGSEIRIVWVANLKPFKCPETFIRLAEELNGEGNVRFIMIGRAGESQWHRDMLSRMAAVHKLEYLGECSQDEVNQVFASADVFVNTSIHEGFPNTFIQAWMRKVPVVSLQVDPDGVLGKKGIGFCSGTYERLRDDVALLIEDSDLRHRMGEKAQDHAFKHHPLKNAEKIIEILEQ